MAALGWVSRCDSARRSGDSGSGTQLQTPRAWGQPHVHPQRVLHTPAEHKSLFLHLSQQFHGISDLINSRPTFPAAQQRQQLTPECFCQGRIFYSELRIFYYLFLMNTDSGFALPSGPTEQQQHTHWGPPAP